MIDMCERYTLPNINFFFKKFTLYLYTCEKMDLALVVLVKNMILTPPPPLFISLIIVIKDMHTGDKFAVVGNRAIYLCPKNALKC